jgi:hypothetical protein
MGYGVTRWPNTYGNRRTFGPFYRQAIRFVGRRLERLGAALDMWSWSWKR